MAVPTNLSGEDAEEYLANNPGADYIPAMYIPTPIPVYEPVVSDLISPIETTRVDPVVRDIAYLEATYTPEPIYVSPPSIIVDGVTHTGVLPIDNIVLQDYYEMQNTPISEPVVSDLPLYPNPVIEPVVSDLTSASNPTPESIPNDALTQIINNLNTPSTETSNPTPESIPNDALTQIINNLNTPSTETNINNPGSTLQSNSANRLTPSGYIKPIEMAMPDIMKNKWFWILGGGIGLIAMILDKKGKI